MIKPPRAITARVAVAWVAALWLAAPAWPAAAQESALEWPVELDAPGGLIVLYQPQVESFEGNILESRGALSVSPADGSPTVFGAVWLESRVSTDLDTRTVTLDEVRVSASRFPEVDKAQVAELSAYLESEIPKWNLEMSLDNLLAAVAAETGAAPGATALGTDPPEILYAGTPTVLVPIDGDAILADLDGADLKYVVNTAYYILQDPGSGRFYLKGGGFWYEASELTGSWTPTTSLPPEVGRIAKQVAEEEAKQAAEQAAEGGPTEDVTDAELGEPEPAAIVVRTGPAEVIQTDGPPAMAPLEGTQLLYVTNTETDLLFDIDTQRYYVLLSGRWYHSASLGDGDGDGDWTYVRPGDLPPEFAKVPPESDLGQILVSVAGTNEAREAALENQIPQTAEVDRKTATVAVTYDGDPEFQQCTDEVAYAINTDKSVLRIDGRFYCCDEAVWFVAAGPDGPWQVATEVPSAVQDIPADCPVYNTRYCYIYESTPEVVYVAYTPGYTGSYVYHGCVVYGTGYWYQPWYRTYYYPRPVTYGFHVHYNSVTGWGFSYGMSVGWLHIRVGRPAYGGWWGPAGYRHGYRHGYHRGYRHGYHGGARAGYRAGYRAGKASSNRNMYANRSTGVRSTAKAGRGSPGSAGTVARTKPRTSQRPNNVYADKKGDVYRNQGGNDWQKRDNRSGDWSKAQKTPDRVQKDSQARQRGTERTQQSKRNAQRKPGAGGARAGGGGRRR